MHSSITLKVNHKRQAMRRRGQSILEYALLIATITAALIVMQRYLQKSVYSNVKALSDQAYVKPH